MEEEDKSEPRDTKTDPDHIDFVRAQEDKGCRPITERMTLKEEADASLKDAGLSPPTPVSVLEMVHSTHASGCSCSTHTHNSSDVGRGDCIALVQGETRPLSKHLMGAAE